MVSIACYRENPFIGDSRNVKQRLWETASRNSAEDITSNKENLTVRPTPEKATKLPEANEPRKEGEAEPTTVAVFYSLA